MMGFGIWYLIPAFIQGLLQIIFYAAMVYFLLGPAKSFLQTATSYLEYKRYKDK